MEYRYFHINDRTTLEELKSQYRKLCMANHPDRGGNSETFQRINLEYREILEGKGKQARERNDTDLFKLINEQIYDIDGRIGRLNVPAPFKPAISYLVERGINELGKAIKRKLQ